MEDGGNVAALGGGIWRWFKIVAAAAEEHAMMVLVSASSKPRTCYYNVVISIGKDVKRGCIQCEEHMLTVMTRRQAYCWGSSGNADAKMVPTKQEPGDNGMVPG